MELQTYGIPTQVLPISDEGAIRNEYHLEWISQRKAREEGECTKPQVIIPRRFDVLFGKGTTTAEHSGNLRAFHIVEMNRARYEDAGKFEKTQIASRIVYLIQKSYGRFLKKEKGCWQVVDDETAREKISHYFRRLRETDAKKRTNKPTTKRTNNDVSSSYAASNVRIRTMQ